MTTPDRESDEKLAADLHETWNRLDEAFPSSPAPIETWEAFVRERRGIARRKLWRELLLFWSVAVPAIAGVVLLATGFTAGFWALQGMALLFGSSLIVGEIRSMRKRSKEEATYE
ncbi:YxlC family protein [Cohnella soli]|uniref:YxlC family protein n=1 Tax=Cohnella soli TaxID=425005 RepID=A0ABW0I6I5_9BACL